MKAGWRHCARGSTHSTTPLSKNTVMSILRPIAASCGATRNIPCWNRWNWITTRACRRRRPASMAARRVRHQQKKPPFSGNEYSGPFTSWNRPTPSRMPCSLPCGKTAGWISAAWRSFSIVRRRTFRRNCGNRGRFSSIPPVRNGKSATDT